MIPAVKPRRAHRAKHWWPEEKEARFLELFGQGLGPLAISKDLGTTRNAVIGKAHRMGLLWDKKRSRQRKLANQRRGALGGGHYVHHTYDETNLTESWAARKARLAAQRAASQEHRT